MEQFVRHVEKSLGMHRKGRSIAVWLIPLFGTIFSFLFITFGFPALVSVPGITPISTAPLGVLGSLVAGSMSVFMLAAVSSNDDEGN